jgi:hypothetical protein
MVIGLEILQLSNKFNNECCLYFNVLTVRQKKETQLKNNAVKSY